MKGLEHFFGILAIGSLIYSIIMIFYAGVGTEFLWFWLTLGTGSIVLRFWLAHLVKIYGVVPKPLAIGFFAVVGVGLAIFLFLEILICSAVVRTPTEQADVILVLGAQVRGTRITRSLRYRLDETIDYLQNVNTNPEICVIVSGGQGEGESISEAQAMKEYLIHAGIDESQIICEDQSTNTAENFKYSMEILEKIYTSDTGQEKTPRVLVVTNGFHLYRALRIAEKSGLTAEGLSAKTDQILGLNYYVREAVAVAKDFAFGNLSLW